VAKENVLVVDDEEDILELVSYSLSKEGFTVHKAANAENALDFVKNGSPDLIVLDLMLPDMEGLEVARRLKRKEKSREIPIIMLTAKTEESDIVAGLELGADDYVTKPFSPRVLIARVKAVLRRRKNGFSAHDNGEILIHDLYVHTGRHEVSVNGRPVKLTLKQFGILVHLSRKPGWVFTRSEIVDAVSGKDYAVTERSVDVQILGLRKKLGHAGDYIETVRGVGYRFKR
jgi:two-component system phosphate regulon response regulator PhoB